MSSPSDSTYRDKRRTASTLPGMTVASAASRSDTSGASFAKGSARQ
jgi:hypothetical protein